MSTKEDSSWGTTVKSQPDEDLKQIAKDLYNGLIYCDRQCKPHEISQRFMVLLFMGPQSPTAPKYPSEDKDLQGKRDNVLYDLVEREADQKKYEEDVELYKIEKKNYQEKYLPSIGFIYEFLSASGPMGLNGGPVFMSARFLNKDDSTKMFGYYEQYKEIREKADNF
jgi:hypothetical protein